VGCRGDARNKGGTDLRKRAILLSNVKGGCGGEGRRRDVDDSTGDANLSPPSQKNLSRKIRSKY